jgi:hypothetical protein
MSAQFTIFDGARIFALWTSPIIFITGVLLLFTSVEQYKKIEKMLEKQIGGIRKMVVPKIENNIYAFHNWLLKRKFLTSLMCIVCSTILFFLLKNKKFIL